MSYLRIKKSRDRKIGIGFVIFGLVIFFLLAYTGVVSILGPKARALGAPIWWFERRLGEGFSNIITSFRSKVALEDENKMLKDQIKESELRATDRNVLAMENEGLKEILDRTPEGDFVLSSILVRPPRSLYDTFILDVGESARIKTSDQVFALGNVLIGDIRKSDAHSSEALLYSTPGEHFMGRLATLGIDVDLIGRGGGSFEVTLARDIAIAKGDEVVSTGLTPYVVATVGEIISDPRDPYQKVILQSPVNIEELRWVEIKKAP